MIKTQRSCGLSLLGRVGGLLLAALAAQACSSPAAPGGGVPTGDDRDSTPTAARPSGQSFYETNPTYTAGPQSDALWKFSTPAAQGLDEATLQNGVHALSSQPSALSLLVIRHGYLVMEQYFHGSRVVSSNNVHSASKSILSALVGIALARGSLRSIDQTLGELLPRHHMKDAATAAITLRDLLTMTSGLAWEEDLTEYTIEKKADWVQAILDLPVADQPGANFNYSTGNAHLISAILTQATGQPLPSFATEALFKPLGITFEHWGKDPQGIASGGCNLYMTPRALARFALLAHGGGQMGGQQLVPAAWLSKSVTPTASSDPGYPYGYLYWLPKVAGHAVAKMWGYGGQFAYLVPDADLVVVLTNDTRQGYREPDGDVFMQRYIVPAIVKR